MTSTGNRTAIIYDFDGTLARGNIQEVSFIPEIGITREEFWSIVDETTRREDGDGILVYMQVMLKLAEEAGVPVTREMLFEHGRQADLYPGLLAKPNHHPTNLDLKKEQSWFERLNAFAADLDLSLEHYIISSGNYEMIMGCPIADAFKQVFACRYMYGDDGEALWPVVAVNYTTKTQFLFRINKDIENIWDALTLNGYTPEEDRPVPFERMIFIGDGETDVPTMKMVTHKGGHSIAVFDEDKGPGKVHNLIAANRVNYVAPTNYRENSTIDIVVKGILGRIGVGVTADYGAWGEAPSHKLARK